MGVGVGGAGDATNQLTNGITPVAEASTAEDAVLSMRS